MPDDFPTLSTVGEANIRERVKRKQQTMAEREEHQRFLANEYERL